MYIFDSKTYLLLSGWIATSRHIILLVVGGGGVEIEQLQKGGKEIEKNYSSILTARNNYINPGIIICR